MNGQWHPDTEKLARHQAGLIGGFRGRRLAAHLAGCARCSSLSEQLAAVGPVLASMSATPMPDAVERQITAAIAAEAATRQAVTKQAVTKQAEGRQAAARPADPRRPRRSRTHGFRLAMAAIPVAACVLGGLGYLLSQAGSPSYSSAAGGASPVALPSGSPQRLSTGATGAVRAGGAASAPSTGLTPASGLLGAAFAVTTSGTSYRRATLGTQVLGVLDGKAGESPAANSTAGSGTADAGSSPAPTSSPSPTLVGCVLHLTGHVRPRLVDRATYAGERAYVIVVASRVLVVGLGCTASHPDLITSAALPQ